MDQPEGFIAMGQENKVCKLVKSMYGLKQAPKQWHQKFSKVIAKFRFTVHKYDRCLNFKNFGNEYIILCLYVDVILILGTSLDAIQKIKDFLSQNFDMKNLGPADMIMGMKISKTSNRISLSLAHSIERMLHNLIFTTLK